MVQLSVKGYGKLEDIHEIFKKYLIISGIYGKIYNWEYYEEMAVIFWQVN